MHVKQFVESRNLAEHVEVWQPFSVKEAEKDNHLIFYTFYQVSLFKKFTLTRHKGKFQNKVIFE